MTTLEVPHLAAINTLPTGLLYPHQADGVSFLISKGRAILGDDMGLGKTRQAIVGMQVAAPTGRNPRCPARCIQIPTKGRISSEASAKIPTMSPTW